MDLSPEGSIYAQRYNVYDYPHVGIIDPRTRRLMWKKEGWTQQNPLTAERFAEIAMDFCSRHSFDRPPQAPRPPGGGNAAQKGSSRPAKRPMHEMTEDEQLQAAMRASLEESGGGGGGSIEFEVDSDGSDDVVIVDRDKPGAEEDSKPKAIENKATAAPPAPPKPQAPASILDELVSFDIGAEPASGARIQFRMPDGKRKIRKFDPSHSVKFVYAFVAVSGETHKKNRRRGGPARPSHRLIIIAFACFFSVSRFLSPYSNRIRTERSLCSRAVFHPKISSVTSRIRYRSVPWRARLSRSVGNKKGDACDFKNQPDIGNCCALAKVQTM